MLKAMVKSAAGFVIFRRNAGKTNFLLLQTSYGEHHWTPPKGHLDPGEVELQAAYRETLEEAGLQQSDIKVFEDTKRNLNYDVKGKPKVVYYWLAELINSDAKVVLSDEHTNFKWLEFEEACKFASYEDMQALLKHYDGYINKNLS